MKSLLKQENMQSIRVRVFTATILLTLLLTGVVVARKSNQSASVQKKHDALIEQIEQSVNLPLRIQQDADTPLRILEATVKEVSAADYEILTSNKAEFSLMVSAPEVRLLNVSGKTINSVLLIVNDVSAQRSTGIAMHHLSIAPGSPFTILPANFVKPESVTTVDGSGKANSVVKAAMQSKQFWLPFRDKSQLQVRVGVEFQDGTKWFNKDQRGENR